MMTSGLRLFLPMLLPEYCQHYETLQPKFGNAPEAFINACLAEHHEYKDANITCRRTRIVLGAKTATQGSLSICLPWLHAH